MSKFSAEFKAAAARKPQFLFLLDFSKLKTVGEVLDLFSKTVHQRVSPGKTWGYPRFQFWKLILDIYSPLVLSSWFDSVNRNLMLEALSTFNFGPTFLRWIRTFYQNITSSVINNGFVLSTGHFNIRTGDNSMTLVNYLFRNPCFCHHRAWK